MLRTSTSKLACQIIWLFVSCVFFASPSHADSTYTYSGLGPFSSFCNGTYGTTPSCTGGLTGSLVLSNALGDSFDGSVTPLSFSFTDGKNVKFTSSSSLGLVFFHFTTNSSGDIIAWGIILDQDNTVNHTCSDTASADSVLLADGSIFNGQYGDASCYNIPGVSFGAGSINLSNPAPTPMSWSVTTPEPSSFLLVCLGLLGVVGLQLKKAVA
jgi:hypothetical protein